MAHVFNPSTSAAIAISAGGEVKIGPKFPTPIFTLPSWGQSFTIHNPKGESISAAPPTHVVFCTTGGRTPATGTLTFTGVGTDTDTITIEGRSYTLKDSVASTADEILIGDTKEDTASNLAAAINCNTSVSGRYGTSTTVNAHVWASVSGAVVTVTALIGGTAGNALATTEASTACSWGGATLSGGLDDEDADGGRPITLLTPHTIQYDGDSIPTYYLHCAQAVDVTIELHGV